MIFWAFRLVKKGRKLATKDQSQSSKKDNDSDVDRVRGNPLVDKHLLQLSKCHLKAKLDSDQLDQSKKIEQAQKELISYLGSEYRKFDKKHSKLVMFKKIRCSLIQNPYDQVGRRMASDVREMFKEHILEEISQFSKLVKYFKIPEDVSIFGINLYSPVVIIMVGLLFRVGIYMYDMHSDVEVIKELREYEIKFKTPSFSDFFVSRKIATEKLESFFLEKFRKDGFPVLTEPCELLDLIEEVAKELIPLYKDLVVDLAQIHWNPNQNHNPKPNTNSNGTMELYDFFQILDNLITIYQDNVKDNFSGLDKIVGHFDKPSNSPAFVKNLISFLQKAKKDLDLNWFKKLFSGIDTKEYTAMVDSGIKVLNGVDTLILNTPFAKVIMKSLDTMTEELDKNWKAGQGLLDNYQKLSKHVMMEFKKNVTYSSDFDPIKYDFSEQQLKCRNTGSKLINLTRVDGLKEATTKFYLNTHSNSFKNSSVNRISQIQAEKLDFLAISIIRSARIFLILTMVWTILHALKNILLNFYLSRHLPLVTNFQMEYKENDSKSGIFSRDSNTDNDYIAKASKRFDFNIQEAIKETLSSINVQVAVWISLATYVEKLRLAIKRTFDIEITNHMFQLKEGDFTEFTNSAIFTSLVVGIVSLTFAQYKQYMTKHKQDSTTLGKLVYLLACLFNSFAIFVTQTTFYIFGFPYCTGLLMVIVRYIGDFDEYDAITKPNDSMTVLLYFVIVLIPLKFIPTLFDKMVQFFTNRWILCKTYHLNVRNRSGYDLSGGVHSMFLPSSTNTYDHVADDQSTINPGFSYFSEDPISKQLYQLKFETHIFHKICVHVLYLFSTYLLLNTVHLISKESTVEVNPAWLEILDAYYMKCAILFVSAMIPLLIISFGLLYVYYEYCHPWVSDGVSVGFEPLDNGLWKPFTAKEHSSGKKFTKALNSIQIHTLIHVYSESQESHNFLKSLLIRRLCLIHFRFCKP